MNPIRANSFTGAVLLGLVMMTIYSVDLTLARLDRRGTSAEAAALFANSRHLLADGQPREAIDRLQRAHSIDRQNRDYALALAEAQMAGGLPEAASGTVEEILQEDSNDARANLLMARILASGGDSANAQTYYHRAIYGGWRDNPAKHRTETRLELASLLAARHQSQELLSEALLLDANLNADAGNNSKLPTNVAQLFLRAGAVTRAAAAFRAITMTDPQNSDAWVGLGEAELRSSRYNEAQAAFSHAATLAPNDTHLKAMVALASELSGLDPTPRRLRTTEKVRRSNLMLQMTAESVAACFGSAPIPDELKESLDAAEKLVNSRVPGTPTNELAEDRLTVAANLWNMRPAECRQKESPDDPVAILQERLRQ